MEIQLREFERCRVLYQKFLQYNPENCTTWIKFAELETILGETERARAIYRLAIQQTKLDMPEVSVPECSATPCECPRMQCPILWVSQNALSRLLGVP